MIRDGQEGSVPPRESYSSAVMRRCAGCVSYRSNLGSRCSLRWKLLMLRRSIVNTMKSHTKKGNIANFQASFPMLRLCSTVRWRLCMPGKTAKNINLSLTQLTKAGAFLPPFLFYISFILLTLRLRYSNLDHIWLLLTGACIGFWVYRGC